MKKIAFTCNQIFTPWGGSEVLWYESALRLRKMGHEVYVYFPKWPTLPKEALNLEKAGCHMTYYEFIRGWKQKLLSNLGKDFFQEQAQKNRIAWLEKTKADLVVLTHLAPRGKEWMRAAKKAQVKYALVIQLADETLWHSAEELEDSASLYKDAQKVYVLSQENKVAIAKQLCAELQNTEIVYNPFQVEVEKPFHYPELIEGRYHIACVARLGIEHKRQDILLEILGDAKWRRREIHLNIFGKGVHEKSLHNLTKFYGLKNVSFYGHVENVGTIWEKNHAFAMPSRYEGVSLAMQEALISYRTCIVTQVGGVSSLIKNDVTGFVAPAATTVLFEEAMDRAWNRRNEWGGIGKSAGEYVRTLLPKDPVAHFVNSFLTLA